MSELNWERDWDVIVADERYEEYERNADRIEDARREDFEAKCNARCEDCGHCFVEAEEQPECPQCGGQGVDL